MYFGSIFFSDFNPKYPKYLLPPGLIFFPLRLDSSSGLKRQMMSG
jgi:hypothetical protein